MPEGKKNVFWDANQMTKQGSHRLGKIKFSDFSLTFPDNFKVFPGISRSFLQQ